MKQIFQSLQNGKTSLEEVPIPSIMEDEILIKTNVSLISAGTEKMLINFGNSNFINKILNNKDKVNQVLDKVKTDGFTPTMKAVNSKLNQSIPMGYSNVGEIVELGSLVNDFKIGDRVLTNGYHAEFVSVSRVRKFLINISHTLQIQSAQMINFWFNCHKEAANR